MKLLICIAFVVSVFACSPSKKVGQETKSTSTVSKEDECEEYIAFIKSQWEKKDSITYQLRGNPEYWNDFNTYTKTECMLGKTHSEIEGIFGLPTKQFILPSQSIWIYCMNEECANNYLEYKPVRELTVSFNENGKVKSFGFNPYFSIKE
jgi:hypothetical protein